MLLMATSVWAENEITIIKMLNGEVNDDAGTVEVSDPADNNGVVTLTVTPVDGNYATSANISVERTIDAGLAQGRFHAPGMNTNIVLEVLNEENPAGTTTYSFAMPDEEYDVEVTVDFQSRTDISAGTLTLTLPDEGYTYDGSAKKPAVTVMLDNEELDASNYAVSYRDSVDAGQATVVVTGIKTYMGSLTEHFNIGKAALKLTVALEGWTYNETPETIIPSVTGNLGQGNVSFTYKAAGANEFTSTVPQNAGTHTVKATVEETPNYQGGEATAEFIIAKADIELVVNIFDWTYGDDPVVPTVDGNLGGGTVTYTYGDVGSDVTNYGTTVPTAAGSYYVKAEVPETDNYNGASDISPFTIGQADFSQVVIADITDQTYTGEPIEPALTVTFKGKPVDASEYTAEYSNNENAGQATVTLTTKKVNFFEGQTNPTKTFQIVGANATITAQDQDVTYNGIAQEFTNYQVTAGSVVVNYYPSEDERTKGSNAFEAVPTAAATYYVQLTQGNANYTSDPVNVTFTINPKQLTDDMLWNEGMELPFDNQPVELEEGMFGLTDMIIDEEIELVEGEDFTVSYENNDKVGTATVTLTGMGNYDGTVSFDFDIVRELNLMFGTDNTGTWATYYAAENLNVPDQLEAYIVTNVSGTTVTTSEIDYIPQGVAVLLKKVGEYDWLTATAYTGEVGSFTDNLLQGCATATDVTSLNGEDDIYVLYNDEFVKTTKGTIPANRCYLPVAKSAASPARLAISIDNEDTGIAEILNKRNAENEKIYNLNGLRVFNLTKGLYIMNGKKFVVK